MYRAAPRRTSPALVRALIALAIVAFLVGVMANGAQAAVLNPDYYQKVLRDEHAYDRAYAELPADKVLAPFSSDLLGGVQLPFATAIPGLLQKTIAPTALESMMDAAIEDLIAYLKKHKDLDPTLDITPFVAGIPGTSIIPGIQIGSASAKHLVSGQFVHEETRDGETRYIVGPPPDQAKKIDDSLFAIQLVSANSYWLRPVGIGLFLAALAGLAFISRRESHATVGRLGLAIGLAGLVTIAAWIIAMPITQGIVIDAAFEGGHAPSEAFDTLARDVLRRCVSNLTPYIFLPAFIAAGIGIALFVLSRTALRPRPA